jgi:glutathione S-transferase
MIFGGQPSLSQEKLDKLDEALGYLEHYLADGYVAGSSLTIADFANLASLATIQAVGHDLSKFPKVEAYLEKAKTEVDGYQELNQEGADMFGAYAKPILKK